MPTMRACAKKSTVDPVAVQELADPGNVADLAHVDQRIADAPARIGSVVADGLPRPDLVSDVETGRPGDLDLGRGGHGGRAFPTGQVCSTASLGHAETHCGASNLPKHSVHFFGLMA
jgi:hypothetical protein